MWIKHLFLGFIGLASGVGVAAGTFAFIIVIGAGIFVGCIAVALAEILNTFPIIFRRFQIKEGLSWIMLFMAFGKCAGAFWYFGHHMTPP